MLRKRRRTQVSIYNVPKDIDPTIPVPIEDHEMVRAVMVDFDELAVSPEAHEQLVADLVEAVRFRRCGAKVGKRGLSDEAVTQQIFLSDIGRALEQAGLPVTRWRKRYDRGDGPDIDAPESFFFRFARELGDAFGMPFPQDLKLPGKRAAQHKYGVMSPAMKTAQDDEVRNPRRPRK